MIFYDKRVLPLFTVYFLVILTFTTGHEGHQNKTVLQSTSNGTNDTQKLDLRNVSRPSGDYVWSNNDDYDDEYSNDEPASDTESLKPEDGKVNGTDTGVVSKPEDASNSTKVPESGDSSKPPQNESISSSVSPSSESSTPEIVSGSPTTDAINSSSSGNVISSTTPTPVDDSSSSTTDTSENEGSTSTPKRSPNPIITEDLGDVSNYSSTPISEEHIDSSGFRTWALAIFSVLISFAVIFTILYFIRKELIRRRKADQRRLLRGSISSEGYFYGDGDGSTKGNFEL